MNDEPITLASSVKFWVTIT